MINSDEELRRKIRIFVEKGGQDAFAFSIIHAPYFSKTSGEKIQRMIDEEIKERETII